MHLDFQQPSQQTTAFPAAQLNARWEGVPTELQAVKQWVAVNFEQREGKVTKVPYDAVSGWRASSTNRSSWSRFDQAVKAVEQGDADAIGFVFTPGDPYVGIDLDHCREPQTGAIEPWAEEIIGAVNSYSEVSVSGRGVHIIAKGVLPEGRGRKTEYKTGGVEMYDRARYFVITGDVLAGYTEVADRGEEILVLHERIFGSFPSSGGLLSPPIPARVLKPDGTEKASARPQFRMASRTPRRAVDEDDERLLENARNALNGVDFRALYDNGDLSAYNGDHSRADLALCAHLAFWTRGNGPRVDRLFRRSALMREKWRESRGSETYGERTIRMALAEGM